MDGRKYGEKPLFSKYTPSELISLAISQDGTLTASGLHDNTIWICDAATLVNTVILRGHTDWVWSLSFSPDNKRLVSGSADETMRIWDVYEGIQIASISTISVRAVSYSPAGTSLACGLSDGSVEIWTGEDRPSLGHVLLGHTASVSSLAFSPNGKFLVSASLDRTVRYWNVGSGAEVRQLHGPVDGVWCVVISPDGKRIIASSRCQCVWVWDLTAEAPRQPLVMRFDYPSAVWSVAISADGSKIASGEADRVVRVWDAHTGKQLGVLETHTADVWHVVFTPDGSRLISSSDFQLRVWDIAKLAVTHSTDGPSTYERDKSGCSDHTENYLTDFHHD